MSNILVSLGRRSKKMRRNLRKPLPESLNKQTLLMHTIHGGYIWRKQNTESQSSRWQSEVAETIRTQRTYPEPPLGSKCQVSDQEYECVKSEKWVIIVVSGVCSEPRLSGRQRCTVVKFMDPGVRLYGFKSLLYHQQLYNLKQIT